MRKTKYKQKKLSSAQRYVLRTKLKTEHIYDPFAKPVFVKRTYFSILKKLIKRGYLTLEEREFKGALAYGYFVNQKGKRALGAAGRGETERG